tara:strand:+ start:234 stop:1238 length:1005 start_codon:yes stop_codon:yes gene_type:complete
MKRFKSRGFPYHRGRRLRTSDNLRDIISETNLSSKDLVMPYFVREDNDNSQTSESINFKRHTINELLKKINQLVKHGVQTIALFPKVLDEKKSSNAEESFNEKNLICRTIKSINSEFPDLITICDIALDAYTLSGHDGIIDSDGKIKNDQTLEVLSKMALNFAEAGCSIVAPSDMMDGRIKFIRENLETKGFHDTLILSYSSKFCSNFYSPFRDALGSKHNLGDSKKNSYQIDFRNSREAIKESLEDIHEGADIIMIKPAGYYLDIIKDVRDNCLTPIAAFQVSGEYCLIKNAAENNLINYENCVLESLTCIKRSGADIIFSYFANEVAEWLNQ